MTEFFDADLILQERLASGGMGEVYRAVQFGLGGFEKTVAVKRILPNNLGSDEFKDMFLRETAICAGLQHPNIVQVFRNGVFGEYIYLVMEFIHGKNVDQLIAATNYAGTKIPIPISCYLISEAAKGLEYAHSLKDPRTGESLRLVHRDISPPNIMVSYGGEVKVVDFGIATAANTTRLTKSGTLKGKESYMAPEQVEGHPIDRRSDIFSLGIVFYELLTGQMLFDGETTFATLNKIRECRIEDPRTHNQNLDDALLRLLSKALSKNPNDRYQTAGEFYRELAVYLNQAFPEFVSGDTAVFVQNVFREKFNFESQKIQDDNAKLDRQGIAERSATMSARNERQGSSRSPSGMRPVVVVQGGVDGSGSRATRTDSDLVRGYDAGRGSGPRPTVNLTGDSRDLEGRPPSGSRSNSGLAANYGSEMSEPGDEYAGGMTSLIARRQVLMITFLCVINICLALVLLKHNGRWPFRRVETAVDVQHPPAPPEQTPVKMPAPPGPIVQNGPAETREVIPQFLLSMKRVSFKPFPPDMLKDLICWYDGDNVKIEDDNTVSRWKDRSSLNHPAEQADPKRRPILRLRAINRLPTLVFDGSKTYLDADGLAESMRSAHGVTAFYVAKSKPGGAQQYVFAVTGPKVTTDILRAGFAPGGRARIKTDTVSFHYFDSVPVKSTEFAIYTVVYEQSYAELFINGKIGISQSIQDPIPYNSSKFLSIGQEWDDTGPSDFLDGEIAELVIYGRALPYQERAGIEKYLSEKYDLPLE